MRRTKKMISLVLSVSMFTQLFSGANIKASKDSITYYDVKNSILDLKSYNEELDTNHDGNLNVFDVIRANKTLIQEESYTDLKEKVYMLETHIESLYQKLNEKTDKEKGKELTSNDYTDEEKNKLENLNNYDDTQLKSDISDSLSEKVDKEEGKQLSSNDYTDEEKNKLESLNNYDDTQLKSDISDSLSGKVDKEEGKQLSSNDYTDEEKNKLESLNNYDDTQLKSDISDSLSGKVDKEEGKQLSSNDYTDEEKNKLESLNNYDDTEIKSELQAQTQLIDSFVDISNEIAKNTVDEGENIQPMKFSNGETTLLDDLTVLANGMYFDHVVTKYRCKLVDNFSHDATVVTKGGKLYCAYVGNKTSTGDSPSSPDAYTALAIVDTNGFGTQSTIENIEVSKKGDVIDGKTIISGTGVPNCVVLNDNTIRIFFSAKLSDDIYYLLYRDFTVSSKTLSSVNYCRFSVNGSSYVFSTPNISEHLKSINNTNYFISMNAQISKSNAGEYYCGVCVGNQIKNSLIFKSSNLETFEFWLEPEFENSNAVFEGACQCDGNYLYYALRQELKNDDISNGTLLVAKIDINKKEIVDVYNFHDTVARPCWYSDGNDIFLIHQIDARKRLEIVKIDKRMLCMSKVVSVSSTNMVYPSCVEYNGDIYFCATGASCTRVYLRKATTFEKYTCNKIQSRLVSSLYLNDDWKDE